MSDNKDNLIAKITSMPKYDEYYSWEYDELTSFDTTQEKFDSFCAKAKNGILWIDDHEIEKFR